MVVLIVLAVLLALIFLVPYGVDAAYEGEELSVRVKAGPLRCTLYPNAKLTGKKKGKKADKKKDEKKEEPADETIRVRRKTKLSLHEILSLVKLGAHALSRFFGSFSVDRLRLHYTIAGLADPYAAAMQYGAVCAAVEELPALTRGKVKVHHPDVDIGVDFTAEKALLDVRIVISLQLYKIVVLAVIIGIEYMNMRKNARGNQPAASTERTEDNGRQSDQ